MLDSDSKKKESGGRKTAISERVASAVRRAQEEIEVSEPMVMEEGECVMEQPELPFYDERSDEMDEDVIVQPESSIDRMRWSTTMRSSETE